MLVYFLWKRLLSFLWISNYLHEGRKSSLTCAFSLYKFTWLRRQVGLNGSPSRLENPQKVTSGSAVTMEGSDPGMVKVSYTVHQLIFMILDIYKYVSIFSIVEMLCQRRVAAICNEVFSSITWSFSHLCLSFLWALITPTTMFFKSFKNGWCSLLFLLSSVFVLHMPGWWMYVCS